MRSRDELRRTLSSAFRASGLEVGSDRLDLFLERVVVLERTGRYAQLVRDLLSCNNAANLKSAVLEVTFAFQFESAGFPLEYEVSRRSVDETSVDFLLHTEAGDSVSIEMRVVQQQQALTDLFEDQLRESDRFGATMDGEGDRAETLRLQRLILSKAVDRNGNLIKFAVEHDEREYSVVAVEVSELHLGMIDAQDCLLCMYGDPAVSFLARRGLLGLFQVPPADLPSGMREVSEAYAPFRQHIDGVLFLRKVPSSNSINFEVEYLFIHNQGRINQERANSIAASLRRAMNIWQSLRDCKG